MDSDEEDADLDLDEQIEDLFKSKRSIKDKLEQQAAAAAALLPQLPPQLAGKTDTNGLIANALGAVQMSVANKLKMAKEIADKVSANRSASKYIFPTKLFQTFKFY